MKIDANILRNKIITSLEGQGFHVNGSVVPALRQKEDLKRIQSFSKLEQINLQKDFILNNLSVAKNYALDGKDLDPQKIELELRVVNEGTEENSLFRWWNLVWWSVPYQRAYGRQMRFIVWDKYHNAPFGLIGLQSPILKMAVRDKYLKIPSSDLDTVINSSMQAQRLGALPPYNDLVGGKMVALTLTSNELRSEYVKKYKGTTTLLKERILEPNLLFITTTSAFGRSSIYNRLKYKNELVAKSLGFTKGAGTFHVPTDVYKDIQNYLSEKNVDINTTFGYGPSRKVKLCDKAFSLLNLKEYHYHNIQREFFLFPIAKNLENVITNGENPIYFQRTIDECCDWWKERWAIKRSTSNDEWKNFRFDDFLRHFEVENSLKF